MRAAILSDIHGNFAALEAVLRAAHEAGAEVIINAGDCVGYYYQPHQVYRKLKSLGAISIRGNHEDMLRDWVENREGVRERISGKYGSGLEVAAEEFSPEEMNELFELPEERTLSIDGSAIHVCHGAPWDPGCYVYPDAPDELKARIAREVPEGLLVMGHTHYPIHWDLGKVIAVNPGSVGQPRDRKPGACWAFYDSSDGTLELRRESYDYESVIRECEQRDPGLPFLGEVLRRRKEDVE